jgi:hypothetical protein
VNRVAGSIIIGLFGGEYTASFGGGELICIGFDDLRSSFLSSNSTGEAEEIRALAASNSFAFVARRVVTISID